MIKTILGERAKGAIDKIPLSDYIVRHWTTLRIHKVEEQLVRTHARGYFAFQQAKTAHVWGTKQALGIYGVQT